MYKTSNDYESNQKKNNNENAPSEFVKYLHCAVFRSWVQLTDRNADQSTSMADCFLSYHARALSTTTIVDAHLPVTHFANLGSYSNSPHSNSFF